LRIKGSIYLKALILAFTVYALFWNLGAKPLAEWDESRYGQIALEMTRCNPQCDFINYYYNGAPEFWTAKPPLSIWSMALSYKIFGYNEFAMRLPATLAGIVALYFLFQFLSLYLSSPFTWYGLAVAVTTKALIGPHISRSGDTDAFLIAALFAFLYYFARFFHEERDLDLVRAGFALGLAFFAKALAIAFFGPAGLFFLFWKSGWKKLIRNKYFYIGAAIFILFPALWLSAVATYGNKDPTNQFGGNAIEVMIFFDVIGRLTGAIDSGRSGIDWGFLPRAMEIRFGVWWILLCFWALFAVLKKLGPTKSSASATVAFRDEAIRREGFILSLVSFFSLMALFFISVVKLDWYLAPLLPFFCILFFAGYEYVARTHLRMANTLAFLGLLVAVSNQIQYVSIDETHSEIRDFVNSNKKIFEEAKLITPSRRLRQDEMLYVWWVHQNPIAKPTQVESFGDKIALNCKEGECVLFLPSESDNL
jgi:4-amino-4-deoxy-L-arabinose transferase-like glycosyltransferase